MSTFSDRPGWEDVVPVPQDDGPNALVKIAYSPSYQQLMDLFRAILRSGELSERVLDLTEDLLDENAANYTVWQYRRQCLRYLGADLLEEIRFMDTFAQENPKNYQIWFHRRVMVEELGDPGRELAFCSEVFEKDAKNYHAWAHRQWVLKTFNLWKGELEFIEQLLVSDIRNNSAWNQRWFVVHSGPDPVTALVLQRELDYSFSSIDQVTRNESSWNYIRGLARNHPETTQGIIDKCCKVDDNERMRKEKGNAKEKDKEKERSKGKSKSRNTSLEGENCLNLSLLADLREAEGTEEGMTHALQLFLRLCDSDTLRVKYWSRRAEKCRLGIANTSENQY